VPRSAFGKIIFCPLAGGRFAWSSKIHIEPRARSIIPQSAHAIGRRSTSSAMPASGSD